MEIKNRFTTKTNEKYCISKRTNQLKERVQNVQTSLYQSKLHRTNKNKYGNTFYKYNSIIK